MPTYQLYRNGEPAPRRVSHSAGPMWPGVALSDGLEPLAAGIPVQLPADETDEPAVSALPQD